MFEYVEPVAIESPCTGVCVIDDAGLCEGCARTLDEIVRWTTMSPAERTRVMSELVGRR